MIQTFVAPVWHPSTEPLARGAVFLLLLGRAFSEPAHTLREILPGQYRQGVIRFKQALVQSLPDMPDQELTWRMHFMFGTLSYAMAGNDALKLIATRNLEGADDEQAIMRRLIPFLAAGLQAPLPALQTKRGQPGRSSV